MLFTIVLQSYNLDQFGDHETNRDLRVLPNALIVDTVDNSSLNKYIDLEEFSNSDSADLSVRV